VTQTSKPKSMAEFPQQYNFPQHFGREAFKAGEPLEAGEIFGESLWGKEWRMGWRAEQAKGKAKTNG